MKTHFSFIASGAGIGAIVGAALTAATHQPQVWLPLGVGIGLAIGVAIRDRKKSVARS